MGNRKCKRLIVSASDNKKLMKKLMHDGFSRLVGIFVGGIGNMEYGIWNIRNNTEYSVRIKNKDLRNND